MHMTQNYCDEELKVRLYLNLIRIWGFTVLLEQTGAEPNKFCMQAQWRSDI